MNLQIDIVWRWAGLATDEKRRKCRDLGLDPDRIFPSYMDDLKYSMRSVLHHCRGWYRKVFLLLDDDEDIPAWLNQENDKLVIVQHSEFIPKEFLPTYNSNVIDSYIHKVPGLSNHFIVSDDDTFICKRIANPIGVFFHRSDGLPIVRHYEGRDRHSLRPSKIGFVTMWQDAHRKYAIKYTRIQHHVQPFYKPLIEKYERDTFGRDMKRVGHFRTRQTGDINLLRFSSGMASTRGDAHMIHTGNWYDFFVEGPELTPEKIEQIVKKKPTFLCINNTSPSQKLTYQLLRRLNPRKSILEK